MPTDKKAADVLADAGRARYGEEWKGPMARALKVRRDTLQYWLNEKMPFGPDHPKLKEALALVRSAENELRQTRMEMEAWLREHGVNL